MTCRFPHCTCIGACIFGGDIPKRDPKKPLFDRAHMREVSRRVGLANTVGLDSHPGFFLSSEDLKMVEFALDFTAERL